MKFLILIERFSYSLFNNHKQNKLNKRMNVWHIILCTKAQQASKQKKIILCGVIVWLLILNEAEAAICTIEEHNVNKFGVTASKFRAHKFT
jgi:hypothetical protein